MAAAHLTRPDGPRVRVGWLAAREAPRCSAPPTSLTGDVYAAQDLVQNTLAQLYLAVGPDPRRRRRRRLRPPDPGQRVPYGVASAGPPGASCSSRCCPTAPRAGLAGVRREPRGGLGLRLLAAAPQRTVVVLRFYEQLTEAEIADLMGVSRRHRDVAEQPRARLAARVAARPSGALRRRRTLRHDDLEDLLTRTLTEVAETTDYPSTSTSTVAARSRALAHATPPRDRRSSSRPPPWLVVGGSGGGPARRAVTRTTRSPTAHPDPCGLAPRPPAGARHRSVAYLDGDTFVTAQRRAGHRTGVRARPRPRATFGDRRAGGRAYDDRSGRSPTISLVSGGADATSRLRHPDRSRWASGDPAYWLSDGCRFARPGAGCSRAATITPTSKGVIYSPVGSTSRGRGRRRHRRAPAGRRVGRAGP